MYRSVLRLGRTATRLRWRTVRCEQRQQALRFLAEKAKAGTQEAVHLPAAIPEQFHPIVVLVGLGAERLGSDVVTVGHWKIFA
jgi:hypothetical protein